MRPLLSTAVLVALLTIAGIAAPAPLRAQATAALHLSVVDASSGEPLAEARVVLGGGRSGETGADGSVLLSGLPGGTVEGEVRHLGYRPLRFALPVPAGNTMSLTIPLEPEPVTLDPLRVEADSRFPEVRSRELREFYQRVRTGTGQYITRADIERKRPRDLSELFRGMPGLRLLHTPAGDKPIMEAKGSGIGDLTNPDSQDCQIQYFLDGSPFKPIHDGVLGAEVALHEIEGIEVYRRGSTVAAKFHRMHNNCGVILIWKKEKA